MSSCATRTHVCPSTFHSLSKSLLFSLYLLSEMNNFSNVGCVFSKSQVSVRAPRFRGLARERRDSHIRKEQNAPSSRSVVEEEMNLE